MSLSFKPLNPVLVRDPITMVDSERDYAILKGGNQVTWKQYSTTSISNSAITFSTPPPSGNVFVDRKQYLLIPVRLLLSGTVQGLATSRLLNAGNDAPRAYPINGSMDVMQSTLNGQSFSIFMADMIHALTHFNTGLQLKEREYSLSPCYPDQSGLYSNLAAANTGIRNPLEQYKSGLDNCPSQRGSFPFTIVLNTVVTPSVNQQAVSAIVDMVLCEPLFLSPYFFGCGDASGFYNLTTQDFNFTFLANAGNRMWSHNQFLGGLNGVGVADVTQQSIITSVQALFQDFTTGGFLPPFSYQDSKPLLLFKYITPDATQVLSPNMPITYPYFDVQRYPLDFSGAVPGINTNPATPNTASINSNNLQLNSIPRMMYIYARRRNQDLYNSPNYTDTYLALESINVTFANYSGLLSSCNKRQLYQIAQKNGVNMSWTQWSGEAIADAAFGTNTLSTANNSFVHSTIGSILAIEFATDLGLPSDMAPGLQGQFQLQVNATFKNNNVSQYNTPLVVTEDTSIFPTLYIIIVSEGSMTIPGLNSCTKQLGVISKQDILNAHANHHVSYDDIREVPYGGNFLSNLKKFGHRINEIIKKSRIGSELAKEIPYIGAPLSRSIQNLGYGEGGVVIDHSQYDAHCDGGVYAGVPVGGRKMSHRDLKHRLSRM